MAGVELPQQSGPAIFDASLLKAGLGFKQAKQTVVDSFEIAYLQALMVRNDGNITRSAQEAGLTLYHLRELLKRNRMRSSVAICAVLVVAALLWWCRDARRSDAELRPAAKVDASDHVGPAAHVPELTASVVRARGGDATDTRDAAWANDRVRARTDEDMAADPELVDKARRGVNRLAGPLVDCYEVALPTLVRREVDVEVEQRGGAVTLTFDPEAPRPPDELVECLRETVAAFEIGREDQLDQADVAVRYSLAFRPDADRYGEVTVSVPVVHRP